MKTIKFYYVTIHCFLLANGEQEIAVDNYARAVNIVDTTLAEFTALVKDKVTDFYIRWLPAEKGQLYGVEVTFRYRDEFRLAYFGVTDFEDDVIEDGDASGVDMRICL